MPAVHAHQPEPRFVIVAPEGHRTSIDRVVDVVARLSGMSASYICRTGGQSHRRFDARAAVAVLAYEFCPKIAASRCDDFLRAGEGTSRYYRSIHVERCALFPDYRKLYIAARIALMAAQ